MLRISNASGVASLHLFAHSKFAMIDEDYVLDMTTTIYRTNILPFAFAVNTLEHVIHLSSSSNELTKKWMKMLQKIVLEHPKPPTSVIHAYAVQHYDFYNFTEIPQRSGYLKLLRVFRNRSGFEIEWTPRFFLSTGRKVIVRETEEEDSNVLLNIPLEGAAVSLIPFEGFKMPNCFKIIGGVTSVVVMAETAADMFEWTSALYLAILKCNKGDYYKMHESRLSIKQSAGLGGQRPSLFVIDPGLSQFRSGVYTASGDFRYHRKHVDLLPMLLSRKDDGKSGAVASEKSPKKSINRLMSWSTSSRLIENEVSKPLEIQDDGGIHIISNTLSVLVVEPGAKLCDASLDGFWQECLLSLRLRADSKAPYLLLSSATQVMCMELDMTSAVFATTLAEFSFCVCSLDNVLHLSTHTEYVFCEWMDSLEGIIARHPTPSSHPIYEHAVRVPHFEKLSEAPEKAGSLSYLDTSGSVDQWVQRYVQLQRSALVMKDDPSSEAETRMILPLVGVAVDLVPDFGEEFCFRINAGVRTFVLRAGSRDEMMDWACSLYFAIIVSHNGSYWQRRRGSRSVPSDSTTMSFYECGAADQPAVQAAPRATPPKSLFRLSSFTRSTPPVSPPIPQPSLRPLARGPDMGATLQSGFLFYFSVDERYASRDDAVHWRKTQVSLKLDEKSKRPYLMIFSNPSEYEKVILDMTTSVMLTSLRHNSFAVCTLSHVTHFSPTDRDARRWIDAMKKAVKEWSQPSDNLIHKYAKDKKYFDSFSEQPKKEGYLLRQSSEKRTLWIRRYFRLVPGYLLVMDNDSADARTSSYPLAGGAVDLVPFDMFDKPNVFKIISGTDVILAFADSIGEMFEWTSALYLSFIIENNGDYWMRRKAIQASNDLTAPSEPPEMAERSILPSTERAFQETTPNVLQKPIYEVVAQVDEVYCCFLTFTLYSDHLY